MEGGKRESGRVGGWENKKKTGLEPSYSERKMGSDYIYDRLILYMVTFTKLTWKYRRQMGLFYKLFKYTSTIAGAEEYLHLCLCVSGQVGTVVPNALHLCNACRSIAKNVKSPFFLRLFSLSESPLPYYYDFLSHEMSTWIPTRSSYFTSYVSPYWNYWEKWDYFFNPWYI